MLKTVILTKNEKQAAKVGIFIGFEGKKTNPDIMIVGKKLNIVQRYILFKGR
jgi:hypothetical protein